MLQQFHHQIDIQCSKCGAINDSHVFWRPFWGGGETVRKCNRCPHEAVTAIVTYSNEAGSSGEQQIYDCKPNEKETF